MGNSEWIKWEGGKCPVDDETGIQVMFRDQTTYRSTVWGFRWEHIGTPGDIVAYRVAEDGEYDKNRDNQQVSEGVVKIAFKETNWGVTPVKDDNEDIGSAATSKHYNAQAIQPIELMEMSFSKEEFKGFLKGNILKYSMRAGSKSGESVFKDTVKAKQYKMWLDLVDQGIKIDPRVHVVIKGD